MVGLACLQVVDTRPTIHPVKEEENMESSNTSICQKQNIMSNAITNTQQLVTTEGTNTTSCGALHVFNDHGKVKWI